MSRKAITEEQEKQVVMFSNSIHQSYSQNEIAEIVGIHRKSVYRIQKKHGLLKQTVELSDKEVKLLTSLRAMNLTLNQALTKLYKSPEQLALEYLNSLSKKELSLFYYNHVFHKGVTDGEQAKDAVG